MTQITVTGQIQTRAALEDRIGRIHRAAWFAQQSAEALGEEGLTEDLAWLLRWLTSVQDDLLRNKPRKSDLAR